MWYQNIGLIIARLDIFLSDPCLRKPLYLANKFVKHWSRNLIKWQISSPLDKDKIPDIVNQLVETSPIWYRLVVTSWKGRPFTPQSVTELIDWLDSCMHHPCFVKPRTSGIVYEIMGAYTIGVQVWFSNKDDMTFFSLTWDTSIDMYRTFDDQKQFEISIRDSLCYEITEL